MIMGYLIDLKAGKKEEIKNNVAMAKISIEIAISKGIFNANKKIIKKIPLIVIRKNHSIEIVFHNFNLKKMGANKTAAKIANLTPDDYAGDGDSDSRESITYVNGMIMKTGYIARAAEVTPVAFDVAFPNGIVSVQVTPVHTTGGGVYTVYVDSVTTSGFDIEVLTDYTGFYWTAIGY